VLSTRESILIRETPHAMLRMRSTPGRLHVASQSVDGNTRYSCYCAGSPCGCEYRPNEWTQTVRLPQQTAAASPTLYTDGGNPSFGAPLYLFYPTTSSYWWDYKISE
jgi:hypothetical protein